MSVMFTCLGKFVMNNATVYISSNVNLYLAQQTGLQLSQFVMDYATVYISLIVNLYLAWQSSLHA